MTRQYAFQLRQHAKGLCALCPDDAVPGSWYCPSHMITARERQRGYNGCKRRNMNAKSYRIAAA